MRFRHVSRNVSGLALIQPLFIFVQIFFGHVVLRNFVRMDFSRLIVLDMLDTRDDAGLERIPLLELFTDTFRIGAFSVAQSLHVS